MVAGPEDISEGELYIDGKFVAGFIGMSVMDFFDKATGNNLIWYDAESAGNHAPVCKKYDF